MAISEGNRLKRVVLRRYTVVLCIRRKSVDNIKHRKGNPFDTEV